ncbi:MAG: hypothetical protein HeimAB125_04460 [Candidatus Heimdallarchaeota archaeon AB_125]|nr:MAG: hypothetical protein HeimAB125_04460 [Candidatus Heimdallarchaeota archaeon AB_125]
MAMKIKTGKTKNQKIIQELEKDYARVNQLTLAAKNGVFNY